MKQLSLLDLSSLDTENLEKVYQFVEQNLKKQKEQAEKKKATFAQETTVPKKTEIQDRYYEIGKQLGYTADVVELFRELSDDSIEDRKDQNLQQRIENKSTPVKREFISYSLEEGLSSLAQEQKKMLEREEKKHTSASYINLLCNPQPRPVSGARQDLQSRLSKLPLEILEQLYKVLKPIFNSCEFLDEVRLDTINILLKYNPKEWIKQ